MSIVSPFVIVTNEIYQNEDEHLLNNSNGFHQSHLPINNSRRPLGEDLSTMFRLRLHVDGFHAEDFDLHVDPGRLTVRGRHFLRCNNEFNPNGDFVSKEFQRTFRLPMNLDIRKATAQFYPSEEVLLIEIPFQRLPPRPIDIFLTIVTILYLDRVLRISYNEYLRANRH